jgi:hypothetical protein
MIGRAVPVSGAARALSGAKLRVFLLAVPGCEKRSVLRTGCNVDTTPPTGELRERSGAPWCLRT